MKFDAHDYVVLQTIARRVLQGFEDDATTNRMVQSLHSTAGEVALHLVGSGHSQCKEEAQAAKDILEEVRAYRERWKKAGIELRAYEADLVQRVETLRKEKLPA